MRQALLSSFDLNSDVILYVGLISIMIQMALPRHQSVGRVTAAA